ncbi:MAG TPA: ATP-binding protein [Gemmatimonadales bacterium]|nr:ATP-binding protein [Gemmatimonadales bacterium]
MRDALQALLREASDAKRSAQFWGAAARILSDWAGGARLAIRYQGINEGGSVSAGADDRTGRSLTVEWRDPEGRHVEAHLAGAPPALPASELEAAIEFSSRLAVMVGRRAALERERRLGSFVVELARWLLAAPETQLLLRYTLQSLMELVEAQGAFVALKQPDGQNLLISPALGDASAVNGMILGIENSATGRVVRTGEPLVTADLRTEEDASPIALQMSEGVRAALMAPLRISQGTVGAVGLLRYQGADAATVPPFSLQDLHYVSAVAAHIAGGIELSEAVAATRAAADRARAMVDASPLPMALVDTGGMVRQVNEAAIHIFGLENKEAAIGHHLEKLGLSPSGLTVRLMLAGRQGGQPWHGRVLVTQPREHSDRRICDCTVTDLRGLGSQDLLVALYDRTDELRAQRELIAREKLATVGEIASGVAHEVNNPLAAIRMEAELLGRSTKDEEASTAAATIVREVDRAARIVRSLLRLARRADITPVRIQLNELVRDVAEIRQRVLRADNIEVRTRMDQAAESVLGLGQELQQVVINLVTNAEHAVRGRPNAVIELATEARGDWVRLTVEDSGPGVPADVRSRIFDPFFTTKSPDEGSGLGLSICQRVVAEVGGRIWLEDSGTLGGARFVVELPAAPVRDDVIG